MTPQPPPRHTAQSARPNASALASSPLRLTRALTRSEIGRDRESNDDGMLALNRVPLFAIADGKGGPEAARLTLTCLRDHAPALSPLLAQAAASPGASERVAIERALARFFEAANEVVFEANRQLESDPRRRALAASLLAATFDGQALRVAHVGDCRAWLLRSGRLRCLTSDQTVAAVQLRSGTISRTEFEMSPFRKTLAQSIGVTPVLDIEHAEVRAAPGDRFLLSSNGLTRVLADAIIEAILGEPSVEDAAEALAKRILEAGAPDNASFIIVDVEGAAHGLGPEDLERAIRRAPLFEGLTDAEWMALSPRVAMLEFATGAHVLRAGQAATGIVTVAGGRLAETRPNEPGAVIRELGPGEAVAALALGLRSDSPYVPQNDLVALEPSVCAVLRRSDYRDVLAANPQLGNRLAERHLELLGRELGLVTETVGLLADIVQGRKR
jgi:serine/threonine protein phosphatase PrpC